MCWDFPNFPMSGLLQRQEKKTTLKVQLVTNRVYPLSTPTSPSETENEEWPIVLRRVSKGEMGQQRSGRLEGVSCRKHWPQPCPPPDLSPSPFCRAIKRKTIFSYCFIKHYVALFIAVSPDSYCIPAVVAQPLTGLKRPIEAPLGELWICQSVTPPQRDTARNCVCFR